MICIKTGEYIIAIGKILSADQKRIVDMEIGEVGFSVPWAAHNWDWLPYPNHLGGLNLNYSVYPCLGGTVTATVMRTKKGWVLNGKLYSQP